MYKLLGVFLLVISVSANAGLLKVVIAYGTGDVPVNSSIDVDADFVALSVTITADAKMPAERAKLINKLQNIINSKASQATNIDFQQGVISLSPREKSSFSISRSYGRNSESKFYILAKLDDSKDIYSATQEIYNFISQIEIPEDTNLRLGNTSLALASPEQYRSQLLNKIKAEINSTKEVLGTEYKVSISGIENPVIVRQKNDKQVTVFIDYQIQLNQ
ncbi:hypothetical protein RI845_16810 [Thalassotalea nanhaiensis]|uniref:DUF541 domain-containing protein n=1 Tax=Thalassotalea nanhaiensis TaxID=3065648 RepID=A0ABY9TH69_9GAMM|nr:hypothetical protein RI845_16810 [Colwelliaceae bacterium SQ345]